MARHMNNAEGVIMLPPSPNWYFGSVADTTKAGVFAFGAKNYVYLLDISRPIPAVTGCLSCGCARVTGCVFSPKPGQERLCVTSGDNGVVQVWDTTSLTCLQTQGQHKSPVAALLWSPSDEDTVLSADQNGVIVQWHYPTGDVRTFCPDPEGNIVSLACSSLQPYLLAAGFKSGTILLLDLKQDGNIVCTLRGHRDEVQSIVWMSAATDGNGTSSNESSADEQHHQLLASGSKDRTIRIWDSTTGYCTDTLKLPARALGYRGRVGGDDGGRRMWVALCWRKDRPQQIISSSYGGDILVWDLTDTGKHKYQVLEQRDGQGHSRVVFTISAVENKVITTSMDRQIILWDLDCMKPRWNLPTLGGFVYAMAFSPLTPGQLAIGVGDGMIRIWNTQSASPFDCLGFWQFIKGKVTSLSWHPTKEGVLAFGTDDGSVGLYDVLHTKQATMSSTRQKKTVYCLSWGPTCAVSGGSSCLALYSCGGEGVIYQHAVNKLHQPAVDISDIIKTTNQIKHKLPPRTEIAWRQDGQYVAIGSEDGSVEVMASPNLRQACIIRTHHKPINKLCWHPMSPDTPAHYSCWLASASNESVVHVHNLQAGIGADTSPEVPLVFTEPFHQAEGHKAKVVDLSWSPHCPGWLVSAAYDNTAQVWDMTKEKPVSNFRGHQGRVLSVQWSPTDTDIVYSGGDDFSVQSWNVSQQEHKEPPLDHKPPGRKPKSKGKAKNRGTEPHKQVTEDMKQADLNRSMYQLGTGLHREVPSYGLSKEKKTSHEDSSTLQSRELLKLLEEKRSQLMAEEKRTVAAIAVTPEHAQCDVGQTSSDVQDGAGQQEGAGKSAHVPLTVENILPLQRTSDVTLSVTESAAEKKDPRINRKKRKGRSLFPLSANMDNRAKCHLQEDCIALADLMCGKTGGDTAAGSGALLGLGLFFDRRSLYRVFREESLNHLENGHVDHSVQLALWKGDIVGALQLATQQGQLTDWLVAIAPQAGHEVWLQTAEAYAQQLCNQDQHYKAVTYLLACHKVYEAIVLLKNSKMFREAVALAKIRLPPHDPLLQEVYDDWATELQKDHCEQAAKCYLAMRQPCDAAAVLARRGDLPTLGVAAKIAAAAGSQEQLSSVACRYAYECQLQCKWQEGQELLKNYKTLQAHRLNLCLHEVLVNGLCDLGCLSEDWEEKLVPYSWGELDTPICLPDFLQYHSKTDPLCPWSPYIIKEQSFLGYVVHVWCKSCGFVLKADDTLQLCHLLSAPLSTGSRPATVAKLISRVSSQVTAGLLCLLGGDLQKAVTHWVTAVHTTHDMGQYQIMNGLLRMLLPYGCLSIRQLKMWSGQQSLETEGTLQQNSSTLQHVISCLSVFYHVATLYELWWGGPYQDSGNGCMAHGAAADHQLCSNSGADIMSAATSTSAQLEEVLHDEAKARTTDQRVAVLIQQLQAISGAVLISDIARKYALEEQLIELQTVRHGSAVNQKQSTLLNNVETCSTVDADRTAGTGHVSLSSEQSPPDSVTHFNQDILPRHETNNMIQPVLSNNKVEGRVAVFPDYPDMFLASNGGSTGSQAGSLQTAPSQEDNTAGEQQDNRECHTSVGNSQTVDEIVVQHMETLENGIPGSQLSQLQQQLAAIPQGYRTLPFPDPVETAMTLVYLCSHWPDHQNIMSAVGHDVISWGLQHSWRSSQRQYFTRWLNKMST